MHAAPKDEPDLPSEQSGLSEETNSRAVMQPRNNGRAAGYSIVKPHGFSSAYRLLRKDGFDRLVHSEFISDKHFKVFFARNSKSNARLGIISSKKILPRAVDRNHAKRVIRETFRKHNIKSRRLDIVVMLRHAYSKEPETPGDKLKILLDRVEEKCAES